MSKTDVEKLRRQIEKLSPEEKLELLEGEEFYVPTETMAKFLSLSTQTLRKWIDRGIIEPHCYFKVGTTLRFRPNATIDSLQRERCEDTNSPQQLEFDFGEEV